MEAIQPSTSDISKPTTDSSTPAAPTTGYPTQIDQLIHNENNFSNYWLFDYFIAIANIYIFFNVSLKLKKT